MRTKKVFKPNPYKRGEFVCNTYFVVVASIITLENTTMVATK